MKGLVTRKELMEMCKNYIDNVSDDKLIEDIEKMKEKRNAEIKDQRIPKGRYCNISENKGCGWAYGSRILLTENVCGKYGGELEYVGEHLKKCKKCWENK